MLRRFHRALLFAALSLGCAPVRTLPLSRQVMAAEGGLEMRVSSVSPSNWFLSQRGGGLSVLAVAVKAQNRAGEPRVLSLDRATLTMSDPGGELASVAVVATMSGEGAVPPVVSFDERAQAKVVRPGEEIEFWVAFRHQEPLAEPGLPRRVMLSIPVEGGPPVDLLLADPSTARPRWQAPPIDALSYGGVHVITTRREASIGVLRLAPKHVSGSVVAGPNVSLGLRGGRLRNQDGRQIECCDLGFGFDVSGAFKGKDGNGAGGPYLGYQAIYTLDRSRPDTAMWHGPAIGIRAFSSLAQPRWASAFPVSTTPSLLGYSAFTLAYVHLFRKGDSNGSPSVMLVFEHSTPEW